MKSPAIVAMAVLLASAIPLSQALALPGSSNNSSSASGPSQAMTEMAQAQAAIKAQQWPNAIALLNKVVAAQPQNADAFNLLGYSTRKGGNPQAALAYYEKALTLNPKHLGAHEYMGEAYLQLQQPDKAEEHLRALGPLCGYSCEEYKDLNAAIRAYKSGKSS